MSAMSKNALTELRLMVLSEFFTRMLIRTSKRRLTLKDFWLIRRLTFVLTRGTMFTAAASRFPSIKSTGLTSQEFCERLLYEKKVATVPGDAFGALGEGHIRCSCASSNANIAEAVRRIGEFTAGLDLR